MRNDVKTKSHVSLSDYKLTLTPDSMLYKQRSAEGTLELSPWDKTTKTEYNEPSFSELSPATELGKTITVLPTYESITPKNDAKNLHADKIRYPEEVSVTYSEDDYASFNVPNIPSSPNYKFDVELPDKTCISGDKSSVFSARTLTLEREIITAGRVFDNYLAWDTFSPQRGDIQSDPIYQHANSRLKEALENFRDHPRKLIKDYVADYERLLSDGILEGERALAEYRHLKTVSTFPNFVEKYPIISEQRELIKIPTTTQFPIELETCFGIPRHAAFLQELKNMFPQAKFELTCVDIPGHVFPVYLIEFHLNDESNDGSGRHIKIQVSDVKGVDSYIDSGLLLSDIPTAENRSELRKTLNLGISPITKEIKQEYCDFMLSLAVLARDLDAVKKFLALGADPNKEHNILKWQALLRDLYATNIETGVLPETEDLELKIPNDCNLILESPLENYALSKTRVIYVAPEANLALEPAILTACSSYYMLGYNDAIEIDEPNLDIIETLINAGADINQLRKVYRYKDQILNGTNCLLISMNECNPDVTSFLVNHGADLSIGYRIKKERHLVSPLDYAVNIDGQILKMGIESGQIQDLGQVNPLTFDYKKYFPIAAILAEKNPSLILEKMRGWKRKK